MNRNLANEKILIEIDAFADEIFDLDYSLELAKEQIKELQENGRMLSEFEEDIWVMVDIYLLIGNKSHFDFRVFDISTNNKLPKEIKLMIKCWVLNMATEYKHYHKTYFSQFTRLFVESKGLRKDHINKIIDFINNLEHQTITDDDKEKREITDQAKATYILALFNFFDFTELEVGDHYFLRLNGLLNKLDRRIRIRTLPPSKSVLTFSYYLDTYFEELLPSEVLNNLGTKSESIKSNKPIDKELFRIYPIVLWWRITNLIPMRPSEFCSIERDCIIEEEGKKYIRLPRKKMSIKNVQIIDRLLIDEEMYNLIRCYIGITEQFGRTKTLISYRSLHSIFQSVRKNIINKDMFLRFNLTNLIHNFYTILERKYNIYISKENRIRPNDTRHLAFISLMLQGHTPVEIARLGGHKTIASQFGYYNHSENWIDCEVYRLMTKHKELVQNPEGSASIPEEVNNKALGTMKTSYKKLGIGFCVDGELMRCESDSHFLCRYWGCEPDEFNEFKPVIKKEINKRMSRIGELTSIIYNINKQIMGNKLSKLKHNLYTELQTNANELQNELANLVKIYKKFGEGMIFNEE